MPGLAPNQFIVTVGERLSISQRPGQSAAASFALEEILAAGGLNLGEKARREIAYWAKRTNHFSRLHPDEGKGVQVSAPMRVVFEHTLRTHEAGAWVTLGMVPVPGYEALSFLDWSAATPAGLALELERLVERLGKNQTLRGLLEHVDARDNSDLSREGGK